MKHLIHLQVSDLMNKEQQLNRIIGTSNIVTIEIMEEIQITREKIQYLLNYLEEYE